MSNRIDYRYDLSDAIGFETASSIRPGTSVLVTGPTMTGKDDLLFELLGNGVARGEAGIVVTTDYAGEVTLDEIRPRGDAPTESSLSAIDCRASSGREERQLDEGAFVYSVTHPAAFTGIGIAITNCFDRLGESGVTAGRLALTSLSTMVRYADRKTVFKFCHVLSQRLDSAGFVGFFALNSGAHDDQTVQVIQQAFDATLEIREENGERQARLRGVDAQPTEWRPLSA